MRNHRTLTRLHKPLLLRNEGGAVLVIGLLLVSVLSIMAGIFLILANTERGISHNSKEEVRAFYVAEAGIQRGLPELRRYADLNVLNAVMNSGGVSTSALNAYITNNDPAGFFVTYARPTGYTLFTKVNNTSATLPLPASDLPTGTGTYSGTIEVKANGAPPHTPPTAPNTTDVYIFPYLYTITSNGSAPPGSRSVTASGDFTLTTTINTIPGLPPSQVTNSFARYALFTNTQTNAAGNEVWFTAQGRFTGPVHTNGHFHFANNPSATFVGGAVTSHSQTGEFYNNGNNVNLNANNNANIDRPSFTGGAQFTRGVAEISMPALTTANAQKSIALYGDQGQSLPAMANGIYIGADASNNMVGGVYVKGDAAITPGVSGGNATYSITQGSVTKMITVNRTNNSTTVQTVGGGTQTYAGVPNGMIYVDGRINSLSGTIGANEQTTIAATNRIEISGNLTYENYQANSHPPTSPATPSAAGQNSVLGILSWENSIRVSESLAAGDISIHATVMAPNGEFGIENYNSIAVKGTLTLLGGCITNTYGAFGTFSGSTLTHGYRRNFVYDNRMAQGMSPPFFPTTDSSLTPGTAPVYIPANAVSASINNQPTWRERN